MDRTPQQILETVAAAKLTMGHLEDRLSVGTDVLDLDDHSVIRTTVTPVGGRRKRSMGRTGDERQVFTPNRLSDGDLSGLKAKRTS